MTEQAPLENTTVVNDEDKPLDPAVERVRRKMMRLMAISVGIMMVGLMAVLFAIVYKISARDTPSAETADFYETVLALPAGAKIVSQSLSGERMSLLVDRADGRQTLYVLDVASGKRIGRIEIGTE